MTKKVIVITLGIIILAVGGYFGYQQYAKSAMAQKAKSERLVNDTVAAVGRLINLPEGDNPQVAVVTDLKPLAEQPFFRNASVGDRVIIYPVLGRAILYNPQLNKIMEIATLQAGAQAPNPNPTPVKEAAATTTTKTTEPKK